jgi:HEAT repeats
MRRQLGGAMGVVLVAATTAAATGDEHGARGAGREDGPRLLKEAVRAGTADASAIAAIANWVLNEKEEKVATGLAEVLGASDPTATGVGGERWNETGRAVFSLFGAVLRQAESNRRGDAHETEIAAVVSAAAPAVAGALREADPAARAAFLAVLGGVGPIADDIVPQLAKAVRHPQREVRMGAATALGALGRSARAAIPALLAAANDPDAEVRAAAADALKRIEGK